MRYQQEIKNNTFDSQIFKQIEKKENYAKNLISKLNLKEQ